MDNILIITFKIKNHYNRIILVYQMVVLIRLIIKKINLLFKVNLIKKYMK